MQKQEAGRKGLGDLAPKFAELNDDVLFGEVWAREDKLSARDRSIITVTALMSKGITDNSIRYHIQNAKKSRRNQNRDGGNHHSPCVLRWLTKRLGGFSDCQGSV